MIKRLPTENLEPKMYLADLNCDNIPHGVKQEGIIDDGAMVTAIQDLGVKYVYIDTAKGPDGEGSEPVENIDKELDDEIAKDDAESHLVGSGVSVKEEMSKAVVIHRQAKQVVTDMMRDIKARRPIDVVVARKVAAKLVESVGRNPDALLSLGLIRKKERYLTEHSVNVAVLLAIFAMSLEIENDVIEQLCIGALLHDAGKVFIPSEILHKPTGLSEEEFAVMRRHAKLTQAVLERTPGLTSIALEVATQHSERVDGTGYPKGLKGDAITRFGRMIAVVDVYDAVTTDRVFKHKLIAKNALKKLLEWSENKFDQELVHAFIRCMGVFPTGSLVTVKTGFLALVVQQNLQEIKRPVIRYIYDIKQKRRIPPKEVDLSRSKQKDEILTCMDPQKLKIKLEDFFMWE